MFLNLFNFGKHLLIRFNKSSQILKNNQIKLLTLISFFKKKIIIIIISFFGEHLKNALGALVVPRTVAGNQTLANWGPDWTFVDKAYSTRLCTKPRKSQVIKLMVRT